MAEFDKNALKIIVCPKCRGRLIYKKSANLLECKKCKLAYKIEGGIPILLKEKAGKKR